MRTGRPHRAGETLAGRYRLISPLGHGGFGEAFRAWDNTQGVPVVLKMPLTKHLDRPVVLERFSREIARLRESSHPHIVSIIDDGRDANDRPFLVMRFLPGGSLAHRKTPAAPKTLHYWLPQLADALDYIHSQGVIHRDVKPANIFFDTQATAFLGDFGIARLVCDEAADSSSAHDTLLDSLRDEESLTRTGSFIGTAVYMAPEGLDDRPTLSPRMDQYSLAVTAYEMLSGELPFRGTLDQLRSLHRSRHEINLPPIVNGLPYSLQSALRKALSRRPEDRFSSCGTFAAAALADVPFVPVDSSHHRFLCPGCAKLVRVPDDFGGKSCRCPDCRVALRVSHDLAALWKREEDPGATALETYGRELNGVAGLRYEDWTSVFAVIIDRVDLIDRIGQHNDVDTDKALRSLLSARANFNDAAFGYARNLLQAVSAQLTSSTHAPLTETHEIVQLIGLCEDLHNARQHARKALSDLLATDDASSILVDIPVLFDFTASDVATGRRETGQIEAEDEPAVERKLAQLGFQLSTLQRRPGEPDKLVARHVANTPEVHAYELRLRKASISDEAFDADKQDCVNRLLRRIISDRSFVAEKQACTEQLPQRPPSRARQTRFRSLKIFTAVLTVVALLHCAAALNNQQYLLPEYFILIDLPVVIFGSTLLSQFRVDDWRQFFRDL